MEELLNQLITVGAGLGILAGAWFIWLISGVANNLFSEKKWSWKRMFEDIVKTLIMGIGILSWVVLMNTLDWYTGKLGMDISTILDGATVVGLLAVIVGGSANYAFRAYKNFVGFIGTDHVAKVTGKQDYAAITSDVKEFLDTVMPKTVKETIEEGDGDEKVLDGEVLDATEAGMGGFNNTYIEPYRSKPQDSIIDPSTCYNRECVSYVAWKIFELTGKWPTRTGGMNAKYWVQRLAENGYTKIVDKPVNGGKYVGVSEVGTYGHVIWFEFDNVVTEYNYSIRGGFDSRTVNLDAYKWVEIQAPKTVEATPAVPEKVTKTGVVTYTYKAGDTFGQVIRDLGLETAHGLWGASGDVSYYTAQLNAQGITGNIPVGKTIRLTRRK